MKKLRTHVFSAIVILISFGDEAESKSLEIDRRLERAVEAWRNGTSLDRADSDRGIYANIRHLRGIYANIPPLRQSADNPGPAVRAVPVVKYGCYWSYCWRSCKKGEQDPSGYFKQKTWHEFCQNDEWCYSDLGTCSTDAGCYEAPKWGCYGTGYNGLDDGRVVIGGDDAPCPGFKGYYCDTKTGRSFGCSDGYSRMWRSCDSGKDSHCKDGYCFVDGGLCTYDIRSIVATVLACTSPPRAPKHPLNGWKGKQ